MYYASTCNERLFFHKTLPYVFILLFLVIIDDISTGTSRADARIRRETQRIEERRRKEKTWCTCSEFLPLLLHPLLFYPLPLSPSTLSLHYLNMFTFSPLLFSVSFSSSVSVSSSTVLWTIAILLAIGIIVIASVPT